MKIEVGDSAIRIDLKEDSEDFGKELEIIEISESGYYYYKVINEKDKRHNTELKAFKLIKKKIVEDKQPLSNKKFFTDNLTRSNVPKGVKTGAGYAIWEEDVEKKVKEFLDWLKEYPIPIDSSNQHLIQGKAKEIFGEDLI